MGIIKRFLTSNSFQKVVNQKALSAFMGWLANGNIPVILLKKLIIRFVKSNQINLQDFDFDIDRVKTFNEFFIRKLKDGKRNFEGKISCPADGFLSAYGKISNNQLYQIKGSHFSLDDLIGFKDRFTNGSFATIYLSPVDYHRVHIPFDASITQINKIPGKLYSVNEKTVKSINNVYCRNERLVLQGVSEFGRFYLVLVGAIVVGKIKLSFTDQVFKFNQFYQVNFDLKRGDEVGFFELGSTVLLVLESDYLSQIDFTDYQKVSLGNSLY